MIAEVKTLLDGTFRRVANSGVSIGFWGLVLLSAMCFPLSMPLLDATADDDWTVVPAIVLMIAAVIWLLVFVIWKLTRKTADYEDRKGAFWPWLGWTLLAFVPTIAVVMGVAIASGEEKYSYLDAIAFTLLPVFFAPLLVHASGRAIDRAGPSASKVLGYWMQRYLPLVAAYFLVTGPATLLSETLYFMSADENLLIGVAASLAYLPAMVLGTVLTVEAFHRMPQKSLD